MKKLLYSGFLSLFMTLMPGMAFAMEKPPQQEIKIDILSVLPAELLEKVMDYILTGKSMEEVGANIRALAQVNKSYYAWLNDETTTKELIKFLGDRFNENRIASAIALRTVGAGRWLNKYYSGYLHTNLVNAANVDDLLVVKFLLDNIPGIIGINSALLAARDPEIVKLLLSKGANSNVRDSQFGRTLLMHAIIEGNIEIVEILLGAGADINLTDKAGHTALWHAQQLPDSPVKSSIIDLLQGKRKLV